MSRLLYFRIRPEADFASSTHSKVPDKRNGYCIDGLVPISAGPFFIQEATQTFAWMLYRG
jgi:hypothetical protein